MGLKNLSDSHVDVNKVSFIGKVDSKVISHLNQKEFFFPVIIDGHLINIMFELKEAAEKARVSLLDDVNQLQGYLPG